MSIYVGNKKISGIYRGEDVTHATEEHAGIIEIATQEEVNQGNDDLKAVTPKKASTAFVIKEIFNQDQARQDEEIEAITPRKTSTGTNSLSYDKALNLNLFNAMYKGNAKQDGTPSPDNPVEIETMTGYNLWNENLTVNYNAGTITTKVSDDKKAIIINGSNSTKSELRLLGGWNSTISKFNLKKGTYSISISKKEIEVTEVVITNGTTSTTKAPTFTLIEDNWGISSIKLVVPPNIIFVDEEIKIQLVENTEQKPYVPYGSIGIKRSNDNEERIDYIDLQGNEVLSTDEIRVDKEGNVTLVKNWNKVVLDGNKYIKYYGEYVGHKMFYIDYFLSDSKYQDNYAVISISNQYKFIPNYESSTMKNYEARIKNLDGRLYWNDDRYSNEVDMKNWLANNPLTIYYILAEPRIINLGKIEPIKSLQGINNVEILANVEPSYMEETHAFDVAKAIEELTQAIVSTGNNL